MLKDKKSHWPLGLQPSHTDTRSCKTIIKALLLAASCVSRIFLGLGLVGFISHTRGRFKLLFIRKGRGLETKRNSQEQPWDRSVSHQRIHTISLSCFADMTSPFQVGEVNN